MARRPRTGRSVASSSNDAIRDRNRKSHAEAFADRETAVLALAFYPPAAVLLGQSEEEHRDKMVLLAGNVSEAGGNGNQKRDLCGHLKRDPPGEVRRGESEPAAPRESSSTTGFRQYVNPCPPW